MALVTRSPQADVDAVTGIEAGNKVVRLPGDPLMAGEDLDPAAPCYINPNDGNLYMTNGTNADQAATVFGFTPKPYVEGEPVSLFRGNTFFHYSDDFDAEGVSPGDLLFPAATAGRLDTAASTGGTEPCAVVVSNQHIMVSRADGQ